MKILIIALLISYTSLSVASPILKCLGKEEKTLYKNKTHGAYLKLNEALISDFIQLSQRVRIKPALLDQICNRNKKSVSLELLKLILLKKEALFSKENPNETQDLNALDKNAIKSIIEQAYYILQTFLNTMQAQAKKPNCITSKLPEIQEFYFKSRYILEEVHIRKLFEDTVKTEALFQKISNQKFFNDCF